MTPVIVLTTVGVDFDAGAFARQLVEQKLAACVNIIDRIHSVYRWEGAVAEDGEQLLVIKSVSERLPELKEVVFARHPYSVPEFVVLPVASVEGPYLGWLLDATSST